jgi:alkylation response protein AidB-like acyl-CoA dehydrogenase
VFVGLAREVVHIASVTSDRNATGREKEQLMGATAIAVEGLMDSLDDVVERVVKPAARDVDESAAFPRESISALADAGILGLVSSRDVGGAGEGIRAACVAVERIAQGCASSAMVVCMHYAATAVLEAHGPRVVRESIARGEHLTTLAFSEAGSRSHFWAPVGTATPANGRVLLNARKSWITSAGKADSYVWSSRALGPDEASTLWLVPADADGLKITAPFDGLGMRGNWSAPVAGVDVAIDRGEMLGPDGGGFDIMMGIVLPWFQLMNAAISVGIMESSLAGAVGHVTGTRLEHLGHSLADLPTIRSYVARARIIADSTRALLLDTVEAVESGREDASLRVLEVKAAAAEAALHVTDIAMRVCGGAAFRKELGIERHFRDARAMSVMAPTTDLLYDFIGKALCGLPLFD